MAMEYRIASRVLIRPDFAEGVRAVIVDTDNAPKWDPATPEAVTDALIDSIFAPLPAQVRQTEGDTPVRRVFLALRIAVNEEFTALEMFLRYLPDCLNPGGRAAILTFHSGEDRRVKKSFQAGQRAGIYARVAEEVIRPGAEEVRANPRASSAKLRWAVRSDAAPDENQV